VSEKVAQVINTGEAMELQPINNLTTVAFRALKNFGTSSEGDCNSKFIRAQQISNTSNWEGF